MVGRSRCLLYVELMVWGVGVTAETVGRVRLYMSESRSSSHGGSTTMNLVELNLDSTEQWSSSGRVVDEIRQWPFTLLGRRIFSCKKGTTI